MAHAFLSISMSQNYSFYPQPTWNKWEIYIFKGKHRPIAKLQHNNSGSIPQCNAVVTEKETREVYYTFEISSDGGGCKEDCRGQKDVAVSLICSLQDRVPSASPRDEQLQPSPLTNRCSAMVPFTFLASPQPA